MYEFAIAIMLCGGSSCDMLQAEPDTSYPTMEACQQALASKSSSLQDMAAKQAQKGQTVRVICLHPLNTIVEVEEPHDVLDTAIVHKEPSASSLYLGLVEKGTRTLVTGLVAGTGWVRVLLPDGKSGYVYADHLRRVSDHDRVASVTAPPAPVQPSAPPQQGTPARAVEPAPPVHAPAPPPAPEQKPVVQAPSAASGRQVVAEFRDCETCPVMVSLPGGSFEMGSNEDYSERPPHRVTLRPFALAKYELTVAEWNACVADHVCTYQPPPDGSPEKRPVNNLSWNDAQDFVRWLRKTTGKPYRLPSEAEWEYAAAAGSSSRYSWGDAPGSDKADCRGCGGQYDSHRPAAVGSYAANALGLHDMLGGVAEWVEDCWHMSYQGAPSDGAAWMDRYCAKHVLRGGSWMNPPTDITVRVRNFYDTGVRYIGNGMRLALSGP